MTKIVKAKLLPQIVIVDTSILWHKDKGPAVDPDFDAFWQEHVKLADLELVIPEVVHGELWFQQFSSCSKLVSRVSEQMASISSIAGKDYGHRMTSDLIRNQVEDKIDKWAKSKNARIAPIPISTIDWKQVCNSAIWRVL